MGPTTQLVSNVGGSAEKRFFDLVIASEAPVALLQRFGRQYHYFSLHQINAFSGIFRLFHPKDRELACVVAEVVYEELGEGKTERIHSVILETFLREIGVNTSELPISKEELVPGVESYVDELYAAFWGDDRVVALASYCFLENSAVQTYPNLDSILVQCDVSLGGREFFRLHAGLEVEHAKTAKVLAEKLVCEPNEVRRFNTQFRKLDGVWEEFWKDIAAYASA